jgi:hypothetical protein
MFRSDHVVWLAIRIRSARRKRAVVRFASDSPLEGGGFEPSVPRKRDHGFRECPLDLTRAIAKRRDRA